MRFKPNILGSIRSSHPVWEPIRNVLRPQILDDFSRPERNRSTASKSCTWNTAFLVFHFSSVLSSRHPTLLSLCPLPRLGNGTVVCGTPSQPSRQKRRNVTVLKSTRPVLGPIVESDRVLCEVKTGRCRTNRASHGLSVFRFMRFQQLLRNFEAHNLSVGLQATLTQNDLVFRVIDIARENLLARQI